MCDLTTYKKERRHVNMHIPSMIFHRKTCLTGYCRNLQRFFLCYWRFQLNQKHSWRHEESRVQSRKAPSTGEWMSRSPAPDLVRWEHKHNRHWTLVCCLLLILVMQCRSQTCLLCQQWFACWWIDQSAIRNRCPAIGHVVCPGEWWNVVVVSNLYQWIPKHKISCKSSREASSKQCK